MITNKQLDILKLIHKHTMDMGYGPTIRELCELAKIKSTSTIHGHMSRLESKGYIRRKESSPRAIKITEIGLEILKENK